MAYVAPGPNNGYLPNWEATGQIVGFVRDPNLFKFNRYCRFRPSMKQIATFLRLNSGDFHRVTNADGMKWADGAPRPFNPEMLVRSEFEMYNLIRRVEASFMLGNLTLAQTVWPVMEAQMKAAVNISMIAMTKRIIDNILDNATTWSGYTNNCTALAGGKIDVGTAAAPYFKKLCNAVALLIQQNTFSVIRPGELKCVIGPAAAEKLSSTQEVHAYLQQSPWSKQQIEGSMPGWSAEMYGLPRFMYNVELIVEDAYAVTSVKDAASESKGFLKDSDKITFLYRPDGAETPVGTVSDAYDSSAIQVYHYAGDGNPNTGTPMGLLTVEQREDPWNRLVEVSASSHVTEKLVVPQSGYLVTDVLTA